MAGLASSPTTEDHANTSDTSLLTSEPTDSTPVDPKYSGRGVSSFENDLHTGYTLHWKNFTEMESWMIKEEEKSTIDFTRKEIRPSQDPSVWTKKYIYVCGRNYSGGKDRYTKKNNWKRKVPVKRTGCPVRLTVKSYPHTTELLGRITGEHSHPIGGTNARFTRLRKDTRGEIERLLRLGIDPKKVVS